jgi:elongation factor P--(R)-beta-lysine ligase
MNTWKRLRQEPELWQRYWVREKVVDEIRAFFKHKGFHEAYTPILVPTPSAEPNLEVFEARLTTAREEARRGFLILSPEYSLKKLLAAGSGDLFEITRCFRNGEEVSRGHNPEFTMLEWYRTKADYTAIMEDVEDLVIHLIESVTPKLNLQQFSFQGQVYDVRKPWPRISVPEAFERWAGIDTETLLSERLVAAGRAKGYAVNEETTWEHVFYQILLNEIEPQFQTMKQPVILYDYPLSQAALSKPKKDEPRLAERFEVFLAGLELGNCFSELTDWKEQQLRLEQDLTERRRAGKTPYGIDDDFIEALKAGMPEAAGIAVGVDRLVMLMADVATVAETLFFPAAELFDLENENK